MAKTDFEADKMNSPIRTILVVLICLAGMGVSLLLFRRDFHTTQQQLEEKPVGTVYWINKSVQRLSSGRLQWERLERYSPVYNGDVISSAVFSDAKIRFTDGETLGLSENTTVLVKYTTGGASGFELRKGEIQVESDRYNLEIALAENTNGAAPTATPLKVNLNPRTSATIKFLDTITVKLLQGSGTFSTGSEFRNLSEGQAVKTGKDSFSPVILPVIMLSPRTETRLLRSTPGKGPVKFTWKTDNPEVILEIAGTKDFLDLTGSWYLKNTDSTEIELPEGTFYWKISLPANPKDVDSGKLDIAAVTPPKALFPANRSEETILSTKPELRFSWSVPEEAEAVLLEVADNYDMTRPRLRQLVRKTSGGGGSYVSSGIEPGNWYWRVYPVYPGGVTEGDSLSSELGAAQGYWRLKPANADIIADDLPSAVNAFSVIQTKEAPSRVNKSNNTLVRNVEPGTIPRLVFPPDNYTLETSRSPDLVFSWISPLAFNARFQIADRSDFAGPLIVDEAVCGSSIQSPFLKPGIYYWRVSGASPQGAGSTSPVRLSIIPSLAAPVLEFPRENERVRIEEGKAVNFSWARAGYENFYVFTLYLEGRAQPLSEISSLQNNSVMVYFDPATTGQFRWTVQGFKSPTETSTGRAGLISEGIFTIVSQSTSARSNGVAWTIPRIVNIQTRSGAVQSPITLVSPSSGITVPGLQALRTPLEARWTTNEPLKNVQLIVSQLQDPSSDPRAIVKYAGTSSVKFPSLSEGIWYWIIRGDTSDGRGATPGDPFWLKVLPIPLLPAFKPDQPKDNGIIDIVQLTRDRNITFRWEPVDGANAYIFSLFREQNPPALLFSSAPENVNSYVLDNLSILNEGGYLWQVEAVYQNNNGVIEQRGKIEQHRFAIMIQKSTDLQTHTQGTMYGH